MFHLGSTGLELSLFLIPRGLDLSDLGIDRCGLLAFGDGNFILQALERLLAGVIIHIADYVLGKVQHTVEVSAGDIQQHTQIGWDPPRVPDVCHGSSQHDMAHALAANR